MILFAAAALPASGREPPSVLAIDGLGKGTTPLGGAWQFHLGDDRAWADPSVDDSRWEQILPDRPWGAQGHEGYVGFAWYRRHIAINLAPGASEDLALFVAPIQDVGEIYWNGQLVGRTGKMPPDPVWYWLPMPQTFGLGTARSGVLAVRVWKAPLDSFDPGTQGGLTATPLIGSPRAIGASKDTADYKWLRSHQVMFGIDSLFTLVALLGLLGWMRDRSQMLIFWMACYAGSAAFQDSVERFGIPLPSNFVVGFSQPLFGLVSVATWFVLILLLDLEENRTLMRIVRWVAIVMMAAFVLDGVLAFSVAWMPLSWAVGSQWIDGVLTAIFTIAQTLPLFLVAYAVARRRRLKADRWVVAVCAFLADGIPTLRSGLAQGRRFTHWNYADWVAAPFLTVRGNPINAQSVASTLLLLAIVYAVYRYTNEERRRRNAIEQEMKNAREVQQILIPEAIPQIPGFAFTSAYRPAQEVGGDFFQIIPLGASKDEQACTVIVLGDVSGKGLKAAMAVSLIVGAVRMLVETTSSPALILAALNRRLHGRMAGGFATAIALRIDEGGHCLVASAGHPAPILNGDELGLPGALPLGLDVSSTYEETSLWLRAGDRLSLYTDGLLEARAASGELYGFGRIKTLFSDGPTAEEASDAAVAFGQDDDITVLTLTRLAGQEVSAAEVRSTGLKPSLV
ncbi:MAG TPA: PP2C family protein-serine/threonine phosphatase [Terracidiphilus sp.]|nr:PP2C family protein-serine/threonine phosphatase [Terracidiphilus sp.]